MHNIEQIIKSARFIVLLGCSCFFIYLVFLIVSYFSAVIRLERQFEESTFPKMTEIIDHKINLFFNPSVKGLSLLSESLDWRSIMQKAVSDHRWIKSQMKTWAAELEVNSIGISDRDRKIVWDYRSDEPIIINPALSRDKWFFDLWRAEKKSDWVFTLYAEHPANNYQLYIDRLIRDRSGRSIGSIAAQIQLDRLREQLEHIINRGERVIILDGKANTIIDISRMEIGEGIQTYSFEDSSVKKSSSNKGDPLITGILAQARDYGRIEKDNKKLFYKRTSLFNGSISILSVMDRHIQLQKEKSRLRNDIIVLFTLFTLFIGGVLITMISFSQRLKFFAMKIETVKSKFEDLLFIITHGFSNEILVLQKSLTGIPDRVSTDIYLRLCEMSLMIQNSVNAARVENSKELIISKPYDFAWQWEKLTGNFKPLSEGKGQKFLSSPAVGCMINNDEEMVYQILANLVSNAIKYAPPGGEVRLNARVEGDSLFITVCDSGPGFIPEDREELYSKFKKLSAKPSGGERSTGLGLYIVKQLADACNVRLTLSQGSGEVCGALWELELKTAQSGV